LGSAYAAGSTRTPDRPGPSRAGAIAACGK
jgi:hypothetical protein